MKVKTIVGTLQTAYIEAMVALKRTSWRRPVSTEQSESTKDILEGRVKSDRPMPTEDQWKAKATGTFVEDDTDVLVGRRTITTEELIPFRANQMRHKVESVGQVDLGTSEERRERAVEAFMSAAGSGKRWRELTEAERSRVKNYFLDSVLGREATAEEVKAFYTVPENAEKAITAALATEVKV